MAYASVLVGLAMILPQPACAQGGGNALDFDGSNDYVTRSYDSDFDFGTSSFTAEGWFKTSGPTATTTITSRVSADEDDAEESSSGSVSTGSSDLELPYDGGDQIIGVRSVNVAVPQGTVISTAKLTFYADETGHTGDVTLKISGEDADNAAAFSADPNDLSNRTKTTASQTWSITAQWSSEGAANESSDLSSIVQEIVNRDGWATR